MATAWRWCSTISLHRPQKSYARSVRCYPRNFPNMRRKASSTGYRWPTATLVATQPRVLRATPMNLTCLTTRLVTDSLPLPCALRRAPRSHRHLACAARSAKMNGRDPYTYLKGVFTRLPTHVLTLSYCTCKFLLKPLLNSLTHYLGRNPVPIMQGWQCSSIQKRIRQPQEPEVWSDLCL